MCSQLSIFEHADASGRLAVTDSNGAHGSLEVIRGESEWLAEHNVGENHHQLRDFKFSRQTPDNL
jgi:hypothetical protein